MSPLPRPVRNNNPLDIESGPQWQGLLPHDQMTPEQAREPRFAVFRSPVWGFRAGALLLRNYQICHQCNTPRAVLARLAPPSENNTKAYLAAYCHDTGWDADELVDMTRPSNLHAALRSLAAREAGAPFTQFYTDYEIEQGILLMDQQEEITS